MTAAHNQSAVPSFTIEPTGEITISGSADVVAVNGTIAQRRRGGDIRVSLKRSHEGSAIQVTPVGSAFVFDAVYPNGTPHAGALVPSPSGSLRLMRDDGAVCTLNRSRVAALAEDAGHLSAVDV